MEQVLPDREDVGSEGLEEMESEAKSESSEEGPTEEPVKEATEEATKELMIDCPTLGQSHCQNIAKKGRRRWSSTHQRMKLTACARVSAGKP